MKLHTYSSQGIVISKRNHGESDRLITILSRDFGKVIYLSKGVRKTKSRKRGHLEIFNHLKFSAATGKGMDLLTEATASNDFPAIRSDLNKMSLAYYFCEVVAKIVESDGHPSIVYFILLNALDALTQATNLKNQRAEFVQSLLTEMGYWPKNKKIIDVDLVLEEVIEKRINSVRVGKRMLL